MNSLLKLALIVGGVVLLYPASGLAAQAILDNAEITFKKFSLAAGATMLDVVQGLQPIIITVEVKNTHWAATVINKFVGTGYMNNSPVASINADINIQLLPGQTKNIDIPILLNSAAVIVAAGTSIQNKAIPPLVIEGEIIATSFTYPVNETIEFAL